MVWPPWLCLSAPASEKYCHSNHGCTVLLRTRRYVPPTPPHGTCWRTAGSLSGRHSSTGEMAGRSMIGPSDARPPSTPPYLGTPSCRAFRPPLSWVQYGGVLHIVSRTRPLAPPVCLGPGPVAYATNARPLVLNNYTPAVRRTFRPLRRPETTFTICASWNRGTCAFPGSCTYRHICGYCQLGHKGIECPTAPEGSEYYRLRMTRTPAAPATALAIPGKTPIINKVLRYQPKSQKGRTKRYGLPLAMRTVV